MDIINRLFMTKIMSKVMSENDRIIHRMIRMTSINHLKGNMR